MIRRWFVIGGVVLVVTGAFNFAFKHWDLATHQQPVDFELNWVAAHRLVDREPLYDRQESKQEGIRLVGPSFVYSNGGTYASFIGTPATALLYAPFTAFHHDRAVALYRTLQFVLMGLAIAIAGFALPRRSRLPAWLLGVGAFLWSYPVAESIGLGQVDGFIMVSLAVALWASIRDRWWIVGAALGIAMLIKISPGLLLVYLVLRGRRSVVLPAIASGGTLLLASAIVGRPADVVDWFTDVLPKLSQGGLLINNQSLPAWLARLFGSNLHWLSLNNGLGGWRFVAPVVVVVGIAAILVIRRHRPYEPLELGAVILVALLAGPISWDHYPTWAILTLMMMAELRYWERRRAIETATLLVVLAGGSGLMRKWTLYPSPQVIASDWTRRVESGTKTVGLIAYLAVALWLLARSPDAEPETPDRTTQHVELGAEGVPARR